MKRMQKDFCLTLKIPALWDTGMECLGNEGVLVCATITGHPSLGSLWRLERDFSQGSGEREVQDQGTGILLLYILVKSTTQGKTGRKGVNLWQPV